jgi:hypothetical protein
MNMSATALFNVTATIAKAITAAQLERAVDPVSYIEKVLRKTKQADWEFTGPC